MNKAEIGAIAPCFIVRDVPATLAFYRHKLGFEITFEGPEPNDIFFGIVERGGAFIMFKAVGVDGVPNRTRDVKAGIMRWDAYLNVPDPDALFAEYSSRNVEFFTKLAVNHDKLRGFEIADPDGYLLYFGRPEPRSAAAEPSTEADAPSFHAGMARLAESVKKGVPTILVPDVASALAWYASLGFKELARYEEDGLVNFGIVVLGKAEVMLNMHGKPGAHDVSLWFYTDRIDDLYSLLKSRKGEIEFEQDIERMFYGARQFCIRDLNGYQLYFIQPEPSAHET